VDAARRCFERFGFEKTTLSDVAAEAGVTRRTVYRYFDKTDELMRAAFALAAGGIVDRMVTRARGFSDPGDRIVEAMVFLCREIPADSRLGPLFIAGREGARAGRSFSSAVTMDISHSALRAVNEDWSPLTSDEVDELVELILRLLQSFLTNPGPRPRSEEELRAFFRRWLLPAIGLGRRPGRASSREKAI
jgi:AcrR family transcriptional regulator